ncbi:MAG: SDR family oxidoreductase [Delftia sp.]|jgi:NAD(P)-dependent dehydrogenase (short-subunit alcohol dehydrogenase family)|nr:SDR family oxidoreductase [Delftia sp.]
MKHKDPFSLTGKRLLITGASSGIGKQTAISCSAMGAQLVITGRNLDRLHETAKELEGDGHTCIAADLTKEQDITLLAENSGQLDGILHAAGISKLAPVRLLKRAHLEEIFSHNTYAPILLTKELLIRRKISKNGSIVFISAIASHVGPLASSAYSASKAALMGATRSLALEVAKKGIRVNCISPGYVQTPMLNNLAQDGVGTDGKYQLGPLGIGEPEDVAYAAIFYLSDASRWITRNYFIIDGGLTAAMDIYA